MSAATHSPGPWVVTPNPIPHSDVCAVGELMDDERLQYGLSHTICYGNAAANARLIAAAPELLEALRIAVRQNQHDMLMTGEELRLCEAAIAKATGGAA